MTTIMSPTQSHTFTAFINFPSPYTQTLLVKALVSTLDSISISLLPPDDANPPRLQWADYDLLSLDVPHANPTTHLISSYIYRKALIRKHQLHLTITEYLAKCGSRGVKSILRPLPLTSAEDRAEHGFGEDTASLKGRVDGVSDTEQDKDGLDLRGGTPRGWVVDVQFADELDELLMDDLYELADGMRNNEELENGEKQWYILKPGFADRAQGIRMFSTEDELRAIFESFEPPSSDEGDYDSDDDDDDNEEDEDDKDDPAKSESDTATELSEALQNGRISGRHMHATSNHANSNGDDDQDNADVDADDDEDDGQCGTGVVMSQLRHFVIQEYMPRPMLFDITQTPGDAGFEPMSGNKFHLRAYVLLSGDYQLYLSRTLLALFSADAYSHPSSAALSSCTDVNSDVGPHDDAAIGDMDAALRPHLTNTCLQTDAYGAPIREEGLVKLFWELEGMDALHLPTSASASTSDPSGCGVESNGKISKEWLDRVFERVGMVLDESVKAGVECGSFGLQLMPNAFEIFGVDLLLSYPPSYSSSSPTFEPPIPIVTLLEFNASPDFHQSGDRLQADILDMFKGVVRGVVAPFFGLTARSEDDADVNGADAPTRGEEGGPRAWEVGEEKWGWRKVGQGQVRGPTV